MIKKLSKYIIFSSILVIIYLISSTLYSRDIRITDALIWYSILYSLIISFNLIKIRKYKWITFIFICCLIVILTWLSPNTLEGNLIEIFFIEPHEVNIPFLPFFEIPIKNDVNVRILIYLIYFLSTLIYWYIAYYVTIRINNRIFKCFINSSNEKKI
jgi:hypothetical protein